jgi:tetratricopeptide (TPR) repeat protein
LALLEGRIDDAERLVAETHSLGGEIHLWAASAAHALQLYLLRHEQGRLAEIEQAMRQAAGANATYPVFRCALVAALAELGSNDDARRELDAVATGGFASLPFDEEWLVSLYLLAEAAVQLGEQNHAATLYDLLLPYSDRIALAYTEISLGPVARTLGLLAATLAQPDEAEKHYMHAIELSERVGARPWLARSQSEYAQLPARDRPGDTLQAQHLLGSATVTYEELGLALNPVTAPKTARS